MDVSSIALQGLQQAQLQLQNAAIGVSSMGAQTSGNSGIDTVALSQQAVSMIAARTQFAASIDIAKIADDMQKNLLNVLG